MANTIGTQTMSSVYRGKYLSSNLQQVLRKALVAEAVCDVDRSDVRYIHNPYSGQPAASIHSSLLGTYAISTFATTEDTLTVNSEFVYSEHIYDFERWISNYDLQAARLDEMTYAIGYAIDWWVVNGLCEDGTGTYDTPTGGFTTPANIPVIMSNLISKVAGYADVYKGLFLIIEAGDIVGFMQSMASSGFSFADAALKNGFMNSYMGVDLYVVRGSTFASPTATGGAVPSYSGNKTYTNDGHRVFGVKGMATYAAPRGIQYEEKMVSGKTGREIVSYGYCGFKVWTQKASLLVDITIK